MSDYEQRKREQQLRASDERFRQGFHGEVAKPLNFIPEWDDTAAKEMKESSFPARGNYPQ